MNTPTYKEQFDKLTEAYIKGEVHECDTCACFVGNLLNNTREWYSLKHSQRVADTVFSFYTNKEIIEMEDMFMDQIPSHNTMPNYENELFIAFEKTLERLKQIHISKGEVIDDAPVFKKRILQPVL